MYLMTVIELKYSILCREAYHEAVQLGHDLLQKHDEIPDASKQDESGDDWSDDSDDEADEGDDDNNMTMKSKKSSSRDKIARKAAKTMAKVIKEGNNEEDAPVIDGKYKKLFDMDFMKRADASKSIRAQDEMKSILKELEFMEDDEEKEYNRDSDDEKYQDFQEDNILLHKPMKKSNKRSSDATSIVTNSTASTSHPVTSKAMSKAQSNNNNVPRPANTVVKDIETAVHHNQSAPIKSVNQSEINMPNPWLEQQEKSTKMEKKAKTGQSSGKVSMNQEDGNKLLIITESTAMKGHFSTKTLETTSKSNADKNTNTNNDKKGTKKTSKESATMNSNASMKAVQSSATTTGNAETSPSPAVPTVQKKPMNERKPLLLQQSQVSDRQRLGYPNSCTAYTLTKASIALTKGSRVSFKSVPCCFILSDLILCPEPCWTSILRHDQLKLLLYMAPQSYLRFFRRILFKWHSQVLI